MTEIYAKSETQASWGNESDQGIRFDTDGGENARQISKGTGTQRLQPDRKNSSARDFLGNSIGGIIDQLLEDAEKQLAKSRECVVWYRAETKEYEQKIENLRKLKELQQLEQQALESSDTEDASPE